MKADVPINCGHTNGRVSHEKENHADNDGNYLEIMCMWCPEKFPSPEDFRRHCIDVHKRNNPSLSIKLTFCCDECGKTFKVKKLHLVLELCKFHSCTFLQFNVNF